MDSLTQKQNLFEKSNHFNFLIVQAECFCYLIEHIAQLGRLDKIPFPWTWARIFRPPPGWFLCKDARDIRRCPPGAHWNAHPESRSREWNRPWGRIQRTPPCRNTGGTHRSSDWAVPASYRRSPPCRSALLRHLDLQRTPPPSRSDAAQGLERRRRRTQRPAAVAGERERRRDGGCRSRRRRGPGGCCCLVNWWRDTRAHDGGRKEAAEATFSGGGECCGSKYGWEKYLGLLWNRVEKL